jgi:hypothetical protein
MRIAVEENDLMIVDLFLANGTKPTGWDLVNAVNPALVPDARAFVAGRLQC